MSTGMREEFIRAALVFLKDPKLSSSSLKDKLEFLRGKGLTDVELDEALNLALVNKSHPNGTWNLLLIIGFCVGGYKLYQAYSQGQQKSQERNIQPQLQQQQQQMPRSDEILRRISDLASEIKLLKTLLLSHERFAAPPKIPEWQLSGDTTANNNS